MKIDGINLKKVNKMAGLSFENGLRLHFDSILLFQNKSYPSAYYLSILAIEEIGKAFLIMDFLYHSYVNGRMEKEWEEKFLELMYFHTVKQSNFAYSFDAPIPTNRFFNSLYKGELEILKQNQVYMVDSDRVETLLNKQLLLKLKGNWLFIGGKTKARLKRLERIK